MAEYLSRRYPATYAVKRKDATASGWYGHAAITEITVLPVGKTYNVEEEEPMALAGILYVFLRLGWVYLCMLAKLRLDSVQDDIAIMIEGQYGAFLLPLCFHDRIVCLR